MSATNSSTALNKMPDVPFISVIMNCYNSARHLREALESVIAQTYTDWEIVFWDNRSTDDSAEIFKSYSDGRFRYFLAPKHTVLGKARNLAVEQARGEWVAFLDCDDLWLPEKLEQQVAIIKEEGPQLGLVYGRTLVTFDGYEPASADEQNKFLPREHSPEVLLPEGEIFSKLLFGNFVPLLSGMVRRSAFWSVGGVNPDFIQAEDYDLFIKISRKYHARALQTVSCYYRVHDENISHRQVDDNYLEAIAIIQQYVDEPDGLMALGRAETNYAKFLFREGRWRAGFSRIRNWKTLAIFLTDLSKSVQRKVLVRSG